LRPGGIPGVSEFAYSSIAKTNHLIPVEDELAQGFGRPCRRRLPTRLRFNRLEVLSKNDIRHFILGSSVGIPKSLLEQVAGNLLKAGEGGERLVYFAHQR